MQHFTTIQHLASLLDSNSCLLMKQGETKPLKLRNSVSREMIEEVWRFFDFDVSQDLWTNNKTES